MSGGIFSDLRAQWRLRRGAATYVASLCRDPDDESVRWLATIATQGDTDRARWELRYARRALGLIVAQRDALDDRTGSIVARELSRAIQVDRNVAAGMVAVSERQFNERLALYRGVLAERDEEGTGTRLGRALFRIASPAVRPSAEALQRAGELLSGYLSMANEELRRSFGTAALPEDQPPSAMAGHH